MSTRKLRIKSSIFNCPVCINRYDQSEHKPLLMPCGKSVCQQCIEANLSASGSFWCPFCNVNHKQINNHFPANDALVYLVKNRAAITDEEIESEEPSDRSSKSSNLSPKLAAILDEIGVASTDLDKSIYKSAQGLNEKFARMESEINERVEKMIDEIKKARGELLKELKKHQQKLLGEENAVLKERNELKISQIDLVNSLSSQSQISEDAQRRAEEIQKRLVKLKEDALNWGKAEVKLDKLQLEQMDLGHLIIENHQESTITSKHNVKFKEMTQLQHQPLYLSYKIPPKSKNFHLGFQSAKMLIKVSEFEEVENFSFRLNIQLVDKNGLGVNSRSLQLDSMRLLRIESNLSNEFFVILVRNHFSNPSKSILLIDSDLNLTSRIDFTSQTIIGLYMTDRWIYIVNKNGSTNKYSYENGELKFLKHFQAKSSTVGFHDANFYCIDWEKGKIKIFQEENGELSNSFVLACLNGDKDANSWLIKVDSLGRLNILNRNSFELSVYNINGDIAFEKKFDSARLKLVDMFFPFNDSTFSLVDHKNKSIHFF